MHTTNKDHINVYYFKTYAKSFIQSYINQIDDGSQIYIRQTDIRAAVIKHLHNICEKYDLKIFKAQGTAVFTYGVYSEHKFSIYIDHDQKHTSHNFYIVKIIDNIKIIKVSCHFKIPAATIYFDEKISPTSSSYDHISLDLVDPNSFTNFENILKF